jgi:hypothetical protein
MSSFNTRITSLKTKASTGARAADVLKHCEKMEKHNTYLKTLLSEANDMEMYNHVLDSHLTAIANMVPEFKMGMFFKKSVKTTLVNPITDKITILRDFIRHSTTIGMVDYKFPEMRQVETEQYNQQQKQQALQDRAIVQRLEDMARARAQGTAQPQQPAPQFHSFGPAPPQSTVPQSTVPQSFGAHFTPPAFRGFGTLSPACDAFIGTHGFTGCGTLPPAFGGFNTPLQSAASSTSTTDMPQTPVKKPRFARTPKSTQNTTPTKSDTPKQ